MSQVAASNFPAGSDSPANLDDVQRAQASFIALLRDGKGLSAPVTLASAATTDIGGQNSPFVEISGTTGITSLGTNYNGPRYLRFTGALLLTHNATTLNLPGAANVTTVAGDTAIAYPNQALNGWNVFDYTRGAYVAPTAPGAASGANNDITSLTALTAGGLPDNSVLTADIANAQITAAKLDGAQSGSAPIFGARAWVVFDGSLAGTNAPTAGGNVTSVTRTGTGQYTVNLTTAMPSANYAVVGGGSERSSSGLGGYGPDGLPTTTSFTVTAVDGAGSFTNTFTRMRFAIVG